MKTEVEEMRARLSYSWLAVVLVSSLMVGGAKAQLHSGDGA